MKGWKQLALELDDAEKEAFGEYPVEPSPGGNDRRRLRAVSAYRKVLEEVFSKVVVEMGVIRAPLPARPAGHITQGSGA